MQKNQAARTIKWLIIITTTFVVTFLILTSYASIRYSHKVLPNTYLLGKNFAGSNYSDMDKYFKENPPFVSGTVNFKLEDINHSATPEELGISVNVKESIEKAIAQNKIYKTQIVTPRGLTSLIGQKVRLKPIYAIDSKTFADKLHDLFKDKEKDYINATVAADNNQVIVKAEESGKKINTDKAEKKLKPYLPNGKIPVIDLELDTIEAKVKANDLAESKEYLAQHISGPIKLTNGYRTLATADLSTIIGWLDQEALRSKEIKINQDALNSWLDENVVAKVAVKSRPKLVSSVDENDVIDEGRPGITVDSKKMAEDVVKIIKENPSDREVEVATTETEPEVQKVSPGYTLGRYPGKYIEIDLGKQMLYQIEGNTLVGSHNVSTGKWSMPTPTGEFAINAKTDRAYSARYDLYMPYWMSFIGSDYGIHELPEWADGTKEGESHLGTPVSHGCVRLGVGDAAAVYNWAEVGTPVVVH